MRCRLVMVVLLGGAALAAAGEKPAEPEEKKGLQKKLRLEFVDTPAEECFKFIQGSTEVNIIIDPACKATDKTPVTLRLANTTLRDVLTWVCELSGRQYEIRDGVVYVTPREGAAKPAGKAPMDDEVVKEFEKKLAKKVNLEFAGSSLAEVIGFFQAVLDVNMIIDPQVEAAAAKPITLKSEGIALGEALDQVLEQAGLRRVYRDGAIFITSKAPAGDVKK